MNELLKEGEQAILSNQNQRAIELIDQVLRIDSKNLLAIYLKAQALTNLNKFEESVVEYDRLLGLVQNDPIWEVNANISKSDSLIELNKLNDAEACLDKALAIKPKLARGWVHKSRIESRRKNFQKSLEYCDRAISVDPSDPRGWNNRAFALYNLRKYKECIKSAKKALSIKSDYAMAYLHMGRAYQELGKIRKSRDCEEKFQMIIRRGQTPEHTRGHLHIK